MKNASGEAIMKHAYIAWIAASAVLSASTTVAHTAREVLGPAAVVPLAKQQLPAKIIVDPPLAAPLARGLVFIQYRTENLRIVPVFGPNALDVSPRIGHIHVVVDDAPWHWADASGEPLILVGLPAGPHKVQIILANANHQPLDRAVVEFVVPKGHAAKSHHRPLVPPQTMHKGSDSVHLKITANEPQWRIYV
jgi:hypothetical protein